MLRVIALWPSAEPLRDIGRDVGIGSATATTLPTRPISPVQGGRFVVPATSIRQEITSRTIAALRPLVSAATIPTTVPLTEPASTEVVPVRTAPVSPPPLVPVALATSPRRFAGSIWAIARGGANQALLGGQLGASQAGVRVTYTLDRGHRLALAGRLATPLSGRGREAAIGFDWQPTVMPLHLVAEQRIGLDGGRGGPTLSVIGGVGPITLARGITLEAYGQAGGIARDRIDGFADGLVRLSHPLATIGHATVDIGGGAWAGAQRGAVRIDAGPSLAMRLPVGTRALRMTADWRQRIAGAARPGSGPALSIGSDF